MPLAKDLRQFIESLNSAGVEFLIVGRCSVSFIGRVTFDIQSRRVENTLAAVLRTLWRRQTTQRHHKAGSAPDDLRSPDKPEACPTVLRGSRKTG